MRHITHILPTAAAATWLALCMAGCTPSEAGQPAPTAALQISSVSLRPAQAEVVTRASYEPGFPDPDAGDVIGVVRPEDDNYAERGETVFRCRRREDGGPGVVWKNEWKELPLTAHDALVCGLYPESTMDLLTLDDPTAVPIESLVDYDPAYNFSYDTQVMNAFHNTASFELKHAMAVMEIALRKSGGTCSLQEISIGDVVTKSTLNLSTATYADPPTEWGVVKSTLSPAKELTADFNFSQFLLVPYTVPVEGLKIMLKVNGDYFSVTVPQATLAEVKPGYTYRVEILVNPIYLQVTEVKIVPWQNVRVGDKKWRPTIKGGELGINVPANEINLGGNICTQADKQLLSQLIWAEGNVWMGSSYYGKDAEWDPDIRFPDNTYAWHSWGDEGDNIDPCEKLAPEKYGTGWMTPTAAQLTALMHCTAINRVRNPKYKNYRLTGMWAMKEGDGGIFLPARGYNNRANQTFEQDKSLYYWSRDEYDLNNGIAMKIIYHSSSDSYTCEVTSSLKQLKYPVRCVKEKNP